MAAGTLPHGSNAVARLMAEAGHTYPNPTTRLLLTICAVAAVMMVTLDGTIAIIALPRIQSSLSASQEQIAWVLTSYLLAGAIATPLSSWLADRFGRNRTIALSVLGFTISSIGCGASGSLEMLVVCRFVQGVSGASLMPLTQVLLLDINPPEKQGPAIALFGIGSLFGPMIGPTLGGWLTEYVSWRWIFFINIPVGIMAFVGFSLFAKESTGQNPRPFDLKGFLAIAVTLSALQLMLDRGQMQDWFTSTEICAEAAVAALFGYLAVVHMVTTPHPFISPAIFTDRNFLLGSMMMALISTLLNSIVPLMTNMMQQLFGYPVMLTGILALPRAAGNMVTILLAGRLVAIIGARPLIFLGMSSMVVSFVILSGISLESGKETLALVAFLQGCGSGLIFLPLTLVVFSTLPQRYRNEGSTVFAMTRNIGAGAGISVILGMMIRDNAATQSRLVEAVRPDNPMVMWRMPNLDFGDPASTLATMQQIVRQVTMVGYVDSYRLLLALAVIITPLCWMMRSIAKSTEPPPIIHVE
jgi:DHA2 family multidrug resistance protein